jgi:hypothetical protein
MTTLQRASGERFLNADDHPKILPRRQVFTLLVNPRGRGLLVRRLRASNPKLGVTAG